MKRICSCGKKHVMSKEDYKLKKNISVYPGDENMCNPCFKDVLEIAYEQSYFGSIKEWGV